MSAKLYNAAGIQDIDKTYECESGASSMEELYENYLVSWSTVPGLKLLASSALLQHVISLK